MRAAASHGPSHGRHSIFSSCSSWLRHPLSVGIGFIAGFITCSIIAVNVFLFGGFSSPQHDGFTPSSADRALVSSLLGGDPAQLDSDIYNHIIHEDHTSAFLLHCLQSTHAPPHSLIVPTRTHPSFALTIQDPQRDPYISKALLQYGVWDAHIVQVVSPLLQRNCMRSVASLTPANAGSFQRRKKKLEMDEEDDENPPSPIQRSRIVEINANVAFFSLYAASMGCDVNIYEPVSSHYQCILTSVCANPTLGQRVTVSPHAITIAHNTTTTVYAGQHFGRRGTDGAINSMDCRNPSNLQHNCANVTGVNLDRELGKLGDIFLVKINLDQNTLQIVKSMSNLLKASKIQYILMAYAPKLYGLDDAQSILRTMDDNGYEATEILYTDTSTSAATQNTQRQSFFQRIRSHLSFQSLLSQKTRKIDSREIDHFAIQIFQCHDEPKLCYVDLLFTLKVSALPF